MTPKRAGEMIISMLNSLDDKQASEAIRTIHDDYEICKLWFIQNQIPFNADDIFNMVRLIHKTERRIKEGKF